MYYKVSTLAQFCNIIGPEYTFLNHVFFARMKRKQHSSPLPNVVADFSPTLDLVN